MKNIRMKRLLAALLVITGISALALRSDEGFSLSAVQEVLSYYGSRGQEVKDIQYRLAVWDYYNGPVDGIYGPRTYDAVRRFQAKNGLKVDGIAGPRTLAALGLPTRQDTGGRTTSASVNSNVRLLAHIIHGEARGEPYEGKVAIGGVILNRVEDPRFPNTIAGVIYEPGAFTAVADGQINLPPDQESYRAAQDALNGWDPSGQAYYYFNPATATNSWIWSRPQIKRIGKHIFCK